MCCYANEDSKKSLLRRFGSRKTIVCWKMLPGNGRATVSRYQYAPGVHVAVTSKRTPWRGQYDVGYPRGIHVYVRRPPKLWLANDYCVRVVCLKSDLVCAGVAYDGDRHPQAVFRKIRITKKAWEEAGLPLEKVKA